MSQLVLMPRAARGVLLSLAFGVPACLEDEATPLPAPGCAAIGIQQSHFGPVPIGWPARPLVLTRSESAKIVSIEGPDGLPDLDAVRFIELGDPVGLEIREPWLFVAPGAPVGRTYHLTIRVAPSGAEHCVAVTIEAAWRVELSLGPEFDEEARAPIGQKFRLHASIVGAAPSDVTLRWGYRVVDGATDPAIEWLPDSDLFDPEFLVTLPTSYEFVVFGTDADGYTAHAVRRIDVTDGPLARIRKNLPAREPDEITLGEASRLRFSADDSRFADRFQWQLWRYFPNGDPAGWKLYHGVETDEWLEGDEFDPPHRIDLTGEYRVVLRAWSGADFALAYDSFEVIE